MKYTLILAALLFHPGAAQACSFVPQPAASRFSESELVVLARPVTISFLPRQASAPRYSGDFLQTIVWEVLLSWKPGLQSGERFTTRREFSGSPGCTSYRPVRDKSAYLLFGRGREPYADFHAHDPAHSSDDFRFLSRQPAQ